MKQQAMSSMANHLLLRVFSRGRIYVMNYVLRKSKLNQLSESWIVSSEPPPILLRQGLSPLLSVIPSDAPRRKNPILKIGAASPNFGRMFEGNIGQSKVYCSGTSDDACGPVAGPWKYLESVGLST